MLPRRRKLARDGVIVTEGSKLDKTVAGELMAQRKVERMYERLQIEHEVLKKAIAFTPSPRPTSLPSSRTTRVPPR